MDAEKCNSDGELKKSKKRSKIHHKVTKKSGAKSDVDMDKGDDFYVSDSSDSDASTSEPEDNKDVPVPVSNAEVSSSIKL